MRVGLAFVAASALLATGCTGGRDLADIPGYGQRSGERLGGRKLNPVANPSEVVATDIAFSRAARDDGQWTAFRRYAADSAVIHGRNGPIPAEPWLAAQDDPDVPVQWTPLAVWSSCDGSTAVTEGKFRDLEGQWGYYVTVWERQDDGRYRWVYDMAAPDEALTARENRERPALPEGDEVIVVQAVEAIQASVADCTRKYDRLDMANISREVSDTGGGSSRDNSLSWGWIHFTDGRRTLNLVSARNGEWEPALQFRVDSDGKYVSSQ